MINLDSGLVVVLLITATMILLGTLYNVEQSGKMLKTNYTIIIFHLKLVYFCSSISSTRPTLDRWVKH